VTSSTIVILNGERARDRLWIGNGTWLRVASVGYAAFLVVEMSIARSISFETGRSTVSRGSVEGDAVIVAVWFVKLCNL